MNRKRQDRIKKIANLAMRIKKAVSTECDKAEIKNIEEHGLGDLKYLPTVFEIARYYGIRYEFEEIKGSEPSYLVRENMIVYISEKYRSDKYAVKQLLAHELGHFFLHNRPISEMNLFPHRRMEEYEANVFSIFLMPQIANGRKWEDFSPRKLNREIYYKIFKNDD